MKKNIVLLGSTGSIGRNCLEIIEQFPDQFNVVALSAGKNIELLAEQIKKFKPHYAAVYEPEACQELKTKVDQCEILQGEKGIKKLCSLKNAGLVVNAIIGSSGLKYTIEAILHNKKIALANKESYVMAGEIINRLAKKNKIEIIPIDSEHSAIFHLIKNVKKENIEKVILTASGGPFLNKPVQEFIQITIEDTLKHPVWSMGGKITVDSATLMNKGFEVIEAHYLFDLPYEMIHVIIHPQSIIHSMIQTIDGEFYAQMSTPDMKNPIMNALSYPKMNPFPFKLMDFFNHQHLTFQKTDIQKFPLLQYCYDIGMKGGNLTAALCVADDLAVQKFLNKEIKFHEIELYIKNIVNNIKYVENPDLDYIFWMEDNLKKKYQYS